MITKCPHCDGELEAFQDAVTVFKVSEGPIIDWVIDESETLGGPFSTVMCTKCMYSWDRMEITESDEGIVSLREDHSYDS